MKKTFSELKEKLDNGGLSSVPDKNGYYIIYVPENFEIKLKIDTDAIRSYTKNGKKIDLVYPVEKLINKLKVVQNIQNEEDRKIFYIGKAEREGGLRADVEYSEVFAYYGERTRAQIADDFGISERALAADIKGASGWF